jgi:Skp family chaperone for outer membrane proteins
MTSDPGRRLRSLALTAGALLVSALAIYAGPISFNGKIDGAADAGDANANVNKNQGKKSRYRFVNINKIVQSWSRAKKMQEDLVADFDRRAQGLNERANELKAKQLNLQSYQTAGQSDELKKKTRELAIGAEEFKYDTEQLKKDKSQGKLRILIFSYQQIQDVVAKWSSENDVDAVFVIQEEEAGDTDLLGIVERASVRQVLWYSKDLDITDDVLKLLEASVPAAPTSRPATTSRPANQGNK